MCNVDILVLFKSKPVDRSEINRPASTAEDRS